MRRIDEVNLKRRLFVAMLTLLCLVVPNLCGTALRQTDSEKQTSASPELTEASRLSEQVVSLYRQGKFDEALPLARRALEIREKQLGREHELVAVALKNLASLYFARKQYDEAAKLYQRTLSVYEKTFGPTDPKTAEILVTLGWSNYGIGDTGMAERCLQRALAIREKALGPESKDVGETLYVLGQFYQKTGNAAKAVDFYKRAILIKEKTVGPENASFRELLEKCSCALTQIGRKEEAEKMRMRGLERGLGATKALGSVLQGHAVYRAEPLYPAAARNERVSGTVIVEVTVNETGNVISTRAVCGPDLLVPAAVEAARNWRFTPTLLSGVAVKVIGTITFNFHL
jgi:TonB family protein